jgi:hypothetical protein
MAPLAITHSFIVAEPEDLFHMVEPYNTNYQTMEGSQTILRI